MSQKENPRNPAGRNGVPTKLKEIRGTLRPSDKNNGEPEPEIITGEIEAPSDVLEDAVDDFQYFARLAQDMGVLSVVDIPAMVLLANNYHIYRKTQKIVIAEPGGPALDSLMSPAMAHKVSRDSLGTVTKLMAKFGMTPNDRRTVRALASAPSNKSDNRPLAPVADFSSIGKYNKS